MSKSDAGNKRKSNLWKLRDLREQQIAWYRQHGKYPNQRIVKDSLGKPYVVGDWSWNGGYRPREVCEPQMDAYIEQVNADLLADL